MKLKPVNENFFKKIDSEIKAYLLGYFIADGNINSNLKRIELGCSINDLQIIRL